MGLHDALFDDSVLLTEEVAAILGLSIWTVQRLARDGHLKAHRKYAFGCRWFFDAASVRALQKQRRYVSRAFKPTVSPYRKRVLRQQGREAAEALASDG